MSQNAHFRRIIVLTDLFYHKLHEWMICHLRFKVMSVALTSLLVLKVKSTIRFEPATFLLTHQAWFVLRKKERGREKPCYTPLLLNRDTKFTNKRLTFACFIFVCISFKEIRIKLETLSKPSKLFQLVLGKKNLTPQQLFSFFLSS